MIPQDIVFYAYGIIHYVVILTDFVSKLAIRVLLRPPWKPLIFKGFFVFSRGKYPNRTPTAFSYPFRWTVLYDKVRFLFRLIVIASVFATGKVYRDLSCGFLCLSIPQPIRVLHRMPASGWRCPGAWFRSRGRIYPAWTPRWNAPCSPAPFSHHRRPAEMKPHTCALTV